jgi:phosphatidylglycerol---prolipoprotein diacylglyceryl transferase
VANSNAQPHNSVVLLATIVHRIDPVIAQIGGVALWWYGLSYTLGFLQIHLFLMRRRAGLALSASEVTSLSLWLAVGVLVGGRVVEVAFDEWPFYRQHLSLIPAYWLGGMATHGLLAGAAAASACFAALYRKPFLELADALVIPGALLMGLGRIGNFIDGQIVGSVTSLPWGVLFPDAEFPRHPVVLYDALKNLLLVPYLVHIQRTNRTPGAVAARFVFWYAFPRIFIDLVRDYPTHRLALGTGQTLNLVMAALGAGLLTRSRLRRLGRLPPRVAPPRLDTATAHRPASLGQHLTLAVVLAFCLVIPSNWTQDVPDRYDKRHPGLHRSWLYPKLATAPAGSRLRTDNPSKASTS